MKVKLTNNQTFQIKKIFTCTAKKCIVNLCFEWGEECFGMEEKK